MIGGGPAGSFFAFFLLQMAEAIDLDLEVELYEPRRFTHRGPAGCNHCGGIVSELLVQLLSTEGIVLPGEVVQRAIDSYMLHMDVGSVRIETPLQEKRIAAVYRGNGPRDSGAVRAVSIRSSGGMDPVLGSGDRALVPGGPEERLPQVVAVTPHDGRLEDRGAPLSPGRG